MNDIRPRKKRRQPTTAQIKAMNDGMRELCLNHCPFPEECKDCKDRAHPYTFRSLMAEKAVDAGIDPERKTKYRMLLQSYKQRRASDG